jgi:hypothetical protein
MSGITPKLLFIGNTQSGFVYSVSTASENYSIIKSINVANTSTLNQVFSIHLVLLGENAGVNNVVVGNVALSANNVFSYETSIVMPPGSSIFINQPESNLTFTISGVEYVV